MAVRFNRGSAIGGMFLGTLVFLVFLVGAGAIVAYTKHQIIQNDVLRHDLELVQRDNIWLRAQIDEVALDNEDLLLLSGRQRPPSYPASPDPTDEPR